jgi:hypothetical protein
MFVLALCAPKPTGDDGAPMDSQDLNTLPW